MRSEECPRLGPASASSGRGRRSSPRRASAISGSMARVVSGHFHILCGRFDWDLPVCCVFLSHEINNGVETPGAASDEGLEAAAEGFSSLCVAPTLAPPASSLQAPMVQALPGPNGPKRSKTALGGACLHTLPSA